MHDRRVFLKRCGVFAGSVLAETVARAAPDTPGATNVADPSERVRFGQTDLLVTRYCQGTAFRQVARTDNPDARRILHRCLDVGVNFFDSAEGYGWGGSETVLGKVIAGRRDNVVICTKAAQSLPPEHDSDTNKFKTGGPIAFTRNVLFRKAEGSLKRLGTDFIDLYLLHGPDEAGTPPEEILDSMDRLVEAGKIRYWGVSNHSADQVAKLVELSEAHPSAAPMAGTEDYHNIAAGERLATDLFEVIHQAGVGLLAFSPQEMGYLSPGREQEAGKLRRPLIRALDGVARELEATRPQVMIAWVLSHPAVTCALGGAESPEHVDDNFAGAALRLPPESLASLNAASAAYRQQRFERLKRPEQEKTP